MKKIIVVLVVIIFILIIVYSLKNNKEYDFNIHFFNAGKADAIVIRNKDKYIMIDTAEESYSEELLKYFKKNKISTIDYLIITHFDKDHVGGASKIIDKIEVKNVLQSNYPKNSDVYNKYIKSLEKKSINPMTINNNFSFDLEDMKVIVNGPSKIYDKDESNNSSLITKLYYKNNSFLFMGDAENARIKDFVSENNEQFDFIKVPYHGRKLKQMDGLINNVKPKYAVITASSDTDNVETINTLHKYGVKTFSTKNHSVDIYSDGKNLFL